MSGFWMVILGIGLSLLGVAVALWDIWLTLKVNSNVMKGFNMDEGKGTPAKARTAATPLPSPSPDLRADISEGRTWLRVEPALPNPHPRVARTPSLPTATASLKASTNQRPLSRPGPAAATAPSRLAPMVASFTPTPSPTFEGFPTPRRHGYRPCEYRDATPRLGEGHKLLKRGMDHARAGNSGLALSFLYPSLQILSQGASTRGEATEAWRAIQSTLESSPTLYRRQAGFTPHTYPPKAGLYPS